MERERGGWVCDDDDDGEGGGIGGRGRGGGSEVVDKITLQYLSFFALPALPDYQNDDGEGDNEDGGENICRKPQ